MIGFFNRQIIARSIIISGVFFLPFAPEVAAEGISLNYDSLSSLEEPLAFEIGNVTFLLNGLADTPFTLDLQDWDTSAGVLTNFQISAETQLSNRWTVGVAYFGQFESDPPNIFVTGFQTKNNVYKDNFAGFVSGIWGGLFGGNVSGLVREQTRRKRGVGNAALAFDNALGGLERWSGGYRGRFSAFTVSAVVDEAANFDLGLSFVRPIGNKAYRFTTRYTNSRYMSGDGTAWFDTHAFSGTAEVAYGSTTFDATIGFEGFRSASVDVNRVYASLGVQGKTGAFSWSLEGHFGQIMGQDEIAFSAGARYDIARGLSANFGINYEKATITVSTISFLNTDNTSATISLRYSF